MVFFRIGNNNDNNNEEIETGLCQICKIYLVMGSWDGILVCLVLGLRIGIRLG